MSANRKGPWFRLFNSKEMVVGYIVVLDSKVAAVSHPRLAEFQGMPYDVLCAVLFETGWRAELRGLHEASFRMGEGE